MSCTCFSGANKVRFIVFTDLVIALLYTIYRVMKLSITLKHVFGVENKQQVESNYEDFSLEHKTLIKYSSVFLITAAVIGLALEMFLFFLLNNGARSKNYRHCKHWCIVRLLLFIVSILGSVIEIVRNQYNPMIDGILEIEKLYRVVELIIVRNFMQELHKGMSDNQFEYNSSVAEYPNGNISLNNARSHSHSHVNIAF